MKLTRKQFDVLETLALAKDRLTQRDIEKITHYSLGTVNRVMKELMEAGLTEDGAITTSGLSALEPYRAKERSLLQPDLGAGSFP